MQVGAGLAVLLMAITGGADVMAGSGNIGMSGVEPEWYQGLLARVESRYQYGSCTVS